MNIHVTSLVSGAPRSVYAKFFPADAMVVVVIFFLAAVFGFAGAPVASAAPASASCGVSSGSTPGPGHSALSCTCPPGTVLVSCIGGAPTCRAASSASDGRPSADTERELTR